MKKPIFKLLFSICLLQSYVLYPQATKQLDSLIINQLKLQESPSKSYLPNFTPLSPNAAAFQKYGDYNVSLETGTISIPIPIYTVKEGGLSLPITLKYHASGHKITELASWVGWGWTLDIGGTALNRSVLGMADDYDISTNYLKTKVTPWQLCQNSADYQNAELVNQKTYDLEPDLFSFSTTEGGAKFYLGQQNTAPLIIPYQPFQITHNYATANQLKEFKVVAPSGNMYVFGGNENNTDYQATFPANGIYSSSGIVAWHLTKIVSPNSTDQINCQYQDGGISYQSNSAWSASVGFSAQGNPVQYKVIPTESKPEVRNTAKNIKKITFSDGEVEFVQSDINTEPRLDLPQLPYLKSIVVYNFENGVRNKIKQFNFNYGYFTDRTGAPNRLKLEAVVEVDLNNYQDLVTSFNYTSNTYSWHYTGQQFGNVDDLKKQDYFGYFNNKNNKHLFDIGSYQGVAIDGGAADRTTDTTYIKQGVLNKINYPTGGYTQFDFEPNQYKQNTEVRFAGGLRVKTIKNYTSANNLANFKRYEYGSVDGAGIGLLTNKFTTPASAIVGSVKNKIEDIYSSSEVFKVDFLGTGGMADINSFEGTPLYYTTVKEFQDQNGFNNGYVESTFSFDQDINVNSPQGTIRDLKPWLRGNLLTKKVFDRDHKLIEAVQNNYQTFKEQSIVNEAKVVLANNTINGCGCASGMPNTFAVCGGADFKFVFFTIVNKTAQSKKVNSVSTSDGVVTKQKYEYNQDLLPTLTSTDFSKAGIYKKQTIKYTTDTDYDNIPNILELRNRNIIDLPVETALVIEENGIDKTISKQKTVFDAYEGTNSRGLTKNILPKEIWVAPNGTVLEKEWFLIVTITMAALPNTK